MKPAAQAGQWVASLLVAALLFEITLRLTRWAGFLAFPPLGSAQAPMMVTLVGEQHVGLFRDRFDHHPRWGWMPQPGRHDELGRIYTVDERGVRGLASVPFERVDGRPRVVLVGDSFTYGLDVSDEETWVHLLGEHRPDIEWVNLGVAGFGVDQMVLRAEEQALEWRPDLVVAMVLSMDVDRVGYDHFFAPKPRFEWGVGGDLVLTGVPVQTPAEAVRTSSRRPLTFDLVRAITQHLAPGMGRRGNEVLSRALVARFGASMHAAGVEPVVVGAHPMDGVDRETIWFSSICPDDAVTCADLQGELTDEVKRSGPLVGGTGHWDARGHRVVARHLADRVDAWLGAEAPTAQP